MSELIDQLQRALRARHYSRRTEQAYCLWVRRYVRYHGLRHPADMAEPEINAFVTHLAVTERVSASTQSQALSAILFLYRHLLHRQVGELHELVRARKQPRLPVVLSREEVRDVLHELDRDDSQCWLIASLLYGAGLRLTECHVRRGNVDFPVWMVESLDRQAQRLGVTRQSIIKAWIGEKLEQQPKAS